MINEDLEKEWIRDQVWIKMEKEYQYELDLKEEFELKPAKIVVQYDKSHKSREIRRVSEKGLLS